jgi:F-type H+-transporting ATPase subunit c
MKRVKVVMMSMLGAAVAAVAASAPALAQEHVEAAAAGGGSGMIAIGAGIAIAGAAFGAALGQGRAVGAAMESIGRNPNSADRIQTPMIIGIAFIEALAIYALVIAFFLQGKI